MLGLLSSDICNFELQLERDVTLVGLKICTGQELQSEVNVQHTVAVRVAWDYSVDWPRNPDRFFGSLVGSSSELRHV